MKKLLITLFLFSNLIRASDVQDGLPEANYEGTGIWKDDEGNEGHYTSKASIAGNELSLEYKYDDHEFATTLLFSFVGPGKFKVLHNDAEIGKGFCIRHHCQYYMEIGDATYGETLDFGDGRLEKFGFRRTKDSFYRWSEELDKIESNTTAIRSKL